MKSGLYAEVKSLMEGEKLLKPGDLVLVAVSGGADSLALLDILHRLGEEKAGFFSFYVGHLHHHLRGGAANLDAIFVREEAGKRRMPCTVGHVSVEKYRKKKGLSLEDAARRLRYIFLEQLAMRIGAVAVATGHKCEDQAETVLLNLLRGTGPDGLAGMPLKRVLGEKGLFLIRPLLRSSSEEIHLYCEERGLRPRFDASNTELRFKRNRVRLELLPLLAREYNPGVVRGLERLSRLAALDRDFFQEQSAGRLKLLLTGATECSLKLRIKGLLGEHEALQGRILRCAFNQVAGYDAGTPGFEHIRAILKLCRYGPPHGRLHLPGGIIVAREYDALYIFLKGYTLKEKSSDSGLVGEEGNKAGTVEHECLPVPGQMLIPWSGKKLTARLIPTGRLSRPPQAAKEACLDYEQVLLLFADGSGKKNSPGEETFLRLAVRRRRPGDRFFPLGAPGQKKLKSYFIDRKVPLEEREQIPLVLAGEEIIWVAGRQISHLCRITAKTETILVLKLG